MEDPFQKPKSRSFRPFFPLFLKVGKKFWLILAGVFIIVLILIPGLYWWYFSQDHLLSLAPVDSILYIHVKQPIWPWQQDTISDLPFDNFYNQVDSNFDFKGGKFKDDILPAISQVAFLLLPNQESNKLDWAFIFKFKNSFNLFCSKCTDSIKKTKAMLLQQNNHLEIKKDILAIATSQTALEKIKEVQQGTVFSLASQIDQKKLDSNFFNLYFNSSQIRSYLDQNNLLVKIFNDLIKKDIYLNLTRVKNLWRFKLTSNFEQLVSNQALIDYLPNNFLFFTNGINLFDLFKNWTEVDRSLADSFNQVADSLQTIYQFDFQKDIANLFNQVGDLIIFNSGKNSIFGFNFAIILPKSPKINLDNFEKLVQIALAQKLPQKVNTMLPDGTEVIELKAESEAFLWQSKELKEDFQTRYLIEPDLNFKIAYLVLADRILIANTTDWLAKVISTRDIALTDLIQTCDLKNEGSFLVLNNKIPLSLTNYLPLKIILIKSEKDNFKGCIFDL